MPYRSCKFKNGGDYQVVNKGRMGRRIFFDEKDYDRFFELVDRYKNGKVKIFCMAAVGNHTHFLLRQVSDGGVEKFMRALLMIYARYFHRRHGGVGRLYRGRFWAGMVKDEDHFYGVMAYVLRNPGKHKMVNLGRDGRSGVRKCSGEDPY